MLLGQSRMAGAAPPSFTKSKWTSLSPRKGSSEFQRAFAKPQSELAQQVIRNPTIWSS